MLVLLDLLSDIRNLKILMTTILLKAVCFLVEYNQIDLEITQFSKLVTLFDQILFPLTFDCLSSTDIDDKCFELLCLLLILLRVCWLDLFHLFSFFN